ncbi:olfactory receptor 56A1-like [Sarcophilus harrisii]|nr:olfactory receptor 56A1-like [Sarcophilus harrisii]
MAPVNNSLPAALSEFLLICFPGYQSWQHWLSLPLSLLFLLAMAANATLLLTIRLEMVRSLHEPMYYLLSLLSLLDIVLCLTVIPKVLAIFWFDLKAISFSACFLQMFIMNSFLPMESCTCMIMAYNRYVAICHPLCYPSIITDQFVVKASVFIIARNALISAPIPIFSSRLHYCGKKVIEHCLCANLCVPRLSCDNITLNRLYQLVASWIVVSSDLILIFISYTFILWAFWDQGWELQKGSAWPFSLLFFQSYFFDQLEGKGPMAHPVFSMFGPSPSPAISGLDKDQTGPKLLKKVFMVLQPACKVGKG